MERTATCRQRSRAHAVSPARPHRLPLEDAVMLVALYAELDDHKFKRAGQRWLVRLIEEKRLSLAQVEPAAVALENGAAAGAAARQRPRRSSLEVERDEPEMAAAFRIEAFEFETARN
jgi:hypothetical protein